MEAHHIFHNQRYTIFLLKNYSFNTVHFEDYSYRYYHTKFYIYDTILHKLV